MDETCSLEGELLTNVVKCGSIGSMILTDKERIDWFWSRVNKSDGCWLYQGAKSRGYGHFYHNRIHHFAHHFSWKLTNSEKWNTKLFLMHTCDTPACVNPQHLVLGSHQANSTDMMQKGRGKGQFQKGQLPNWAKLDKEQAEQIRAELNQFRQTNGKLKYGSLSVLGKKYGLSKDTLSKIAKGETYK